MNEDQLFFKYSSTQWIPKTFFSGVPLGWKIWEKAREKNKTGERQIRKIGKCKEEKERDRMGRQKPWKKEENEMGE